MSGEQDITINKSSNLAKSFLFSILKKIQHGSILIKDEFSTTLFTGQSQPTSKVITINVYDFSVYREILLSGSIGAGKSYMHGHWDTDDLDQLIEVIIKNTQLFEGIETPIARIYNSVLRIYNTFKPNNIFRAKKNILSHYDLGNEFFQTFLDPTLMYSCALYDSETTTLEYASQKKLATLCQHLALKPSDHLLEIGTGWGGLAIFAAQNYGCKVTTTTVSDKQYAYVKQQIEKLGLHKQIELLNKDYRQLTGKYDKLVSIEMIEAIGYRYFDTYFNQCNKLLKPGGLFLLQSIIINDPAYDRAKHEIDFIKKYIFPGGCLPSISAITTAIAKETQLQLIYLQDIGKHYVQTLKDWQRNLQKNVALIKQQNFSEEFIRMWMFYFSYCIAGFNTAYISDIHALWRKRV